MAQAKKGTPLHSLETWGRNLEPSEASPTSSTSIPAESEWKRPWQSVEQQRRRLFTRVVDGSQSSQLHAAEAAASNFFCITEDVHYGF